jgi:MerR family mercuric resistance operon transcriptional regulator
MRRGELARRSGCHSETVRFYEKQGLLAAPPRTAGGHRAYAREHLRRLVFVRRARELGFSLEQIRGLLALVDGGYTCAEVRALTLAHLDDIRSKVADLERMAAVLADVAASCSGDEVPSVGAALKTGRDGRCPEA